MMHYIYTSGKIRFNIVIKVTKFTTKKGSFHGRPRFSKVRTAVRKSG